MYVGAHEEENLLGSGHIEKDYSDVMVEDHPYYHLFKDKLPKLNRIF
jgi:hypothetical protein